MTIKAQKGEQHGDRYSNNRNLCNSYGVFIRSLGK